jgi:hypothetical protein
MPPRVPPGWPSAVPDPDHDEFVARSSAWMLDLGSPEWRMQPVWREFPVALAHRLIRDLEARREGARAAYATARADLGPTGVDVDQVLQALEVEGAYLSARLREVELVHEALSGRRWVNRL